MESIGLFTPPAQRMSMSWSTFWRRPEEKKLEPLLWLSLATVSLLIRLAHESGSCTAIGALDQVDWRSASKTCSRSSKLRERGERRQAG